MLDVERDIERLVMPDFTHKKRSSEMNVRQKIQIQICLLYTSVFSLPEHILIKTQAYGDLVGDPG